MELRCVTVGGWDFIFQMLPRKVLIAAINKGQWARRDQALAEALIVLLGHNRG